MLTNRGFRNSLLPVGAARIGAQCDGPTVAVNRQTRPKRRGRWFLTAAFRLWARASICLAFGGTMAAESVPTVCVEADLKLPHASRLTARLRTLLPRCWRKHSSPCWKRARPAIRVTSKRR